MSIWNPLNPTEISLKPTKSGLAVTARLKLPVEVSATLLLRWGELVLMIGLLGVGWLVVHFRKQLAATWLIAEWAPSHLPLAITLITAIAFLLGAFVTLWKKKQLFTYSIAEIAFALFSISQIAGHLWPVGRLVDFLGLGSLLYVVSRGFGNLWDAFIQQGIERLKLKPSWEEYLKTIKSIADES